MLPKVLKPFLWSYDFEKLDKENNKRVIIENVLNYGTAEATDSLFSFYTKDEIRNTLKELKPSTFNRKSLNFWNLILN